VVTIASLDLFYTARSETFRIFFTLHYIQSAVYTYKLK